MPDCAISGDPEMYGLGIRIGFYLQWISMAVGLLMACTAKEKLEEALEELDSVTFINALFVFATIMSLVIKTGNDETGLQAPEIYVVLLFTYARVEAKLVWSVVLATYSIYKVIKNGKVIPSSGPRASLSSGQMAEEENPSCVVGDILGYTVHFAVNIYRLWFWVKGVNTRSKCAGFGFFFTKVSLTTTWFRVVQIVLITVMLLHLIWGSVELMDSVAKWKRTLKRTKGQEKINGYTQLAQELCGILYGVVSVELSIHWNDLEGVNAVSSAGQIIPLVPGAACLVRMFYVWYWPHA